MRSKIFIIILLLLLTVFVLLIISGKKANVEQNARSNQNEQNSEAVPFSIGPSGPPVISEPTSPPPS